MWVNEVGRKIKAYTNPSSTWVNSSMLVSSLQTFSNSSVISHQTIIQCLLPTSWDPTTGKNECHPGLDLTANKKFPPQNWKFSLLVSLVRLATASSFLPRCSCYLGYYSSSSSLVSLAKVGLLLDSTSSRKEHLWLFRCSVARPDCLRTSKLTHQYHYFVR